MARATAALLLVLAACRAAMAADANAWKSQIMYFLLTDRFAQSPGTKPGSSCDLTGWNNGAPPSFMLAQCTMCPCTK
jgi:hypothetical protein